MQVRESTIPESVAATVLRPNWDDRDDFRNFPKFIERIENVEKRNFVKFECRECNRSYASQKSLNKHSRSKHVSMISKYKCDKCGSLVGQACSLKEHYEKVHHHKITIDFAKKQKCDPQPNDYVPKNALWKIEQEKFTCHCGVTCSGRSNFTRHKKTQHPNSNATNTNTTSKPKSTCRRKLKKTSVKSHTMISSSNKTTSRISLRPGLRCKTTQHPATLQIQQPGVNVLPRIHELNDDNDDGDDYDANYDMEGTEIASNETISNAPDEIILMTKEVTSTPTSTNTNTPLISSPTKYQEHPPKRSSEQPGSPVFFDDFTSINSNSCNNASLSPISSMATSLQQPPIAQVSSGPINACLMMSPYQTAPILISPSDLNRLTPSKVQMSAMSPISPCISDTESSNDRIRQARRRISLNSDKLTPSSKRSKKIMTWVPATQLKSISPHCSPTYGSVFNVEPFESKTMQLPVISSTTIPSPINSQRIFVEKDDPMPTQYEHSFDFIGKVEFEDDDDVFWRGGGDEVITIDSSSDDSDNDIQPQKPESTVNRNVDLCPELAAYLPAIGTLPKIPKRKNIEKSVPTGQTNTSRIPFGKIDLVKIEKDEFEIPECILKLEVYNDLSKLDEVKNLYDQLEFGSEKWYISKFTTLIHLEEAATRKRLANSNLTEVEIYPKSRQEFAININNFDTSNVSPMDWAQIESTDGTINVHANLKILGRNVLFKIKQGSEELLDTHKYKEFNITFHPNRTVFLIQHRALEWVKQHELFEIFLRNESSLSYPDTKFLAEQNHKFSSSIIGTLNEEQSKAVTNIVQAKNRPLPYLLFGPPGTGKTKTLVTAIEVIVKSSEKSVLICAQSNSACDELTTRLINVLPDGQILRLYAKSVSIESISDEIAHVCNINHGNIEMPSIQYIYQFRVVICTLLMAGQFTLAREKDNTFNPNHFDYVIIDEAASCQQTVSFCAIAGLCTNPREICSSVVLAGDPKQLDAVTMSSHAAKMGIKTSLMEYFFNLPCYKADPISGQFNPNFIVQLTKNYRSHEAILHVSNQLYYGGTLEAMASNDTKNWFVGTEILPNKEFPIIFESIAGLFKRSGTSFYNQEEIEVVMLYVDKILCKSWKSRTLNPNDIGIVTPYREQSRMIKERCISKGYHEISVGTAEIFQGQERPVVIVSTVCVGDLRFVKDPRRMNVMITRPKSLLIIVGHYDTLFADKLNWRPLIEFCDEHEAIVRKGKKLHKRITF